MCEKPVCVCIWNKIRGGGGINGTLNRGYIAAWSNTSQMLTDYYCKVNADMRVSCSSIF